MSLHFYEAVMALSPDSEPAQHKEFFKQIQEVIQKFSGSIHHVDILDSSRPLANTCGKVKKHARALFFHISYKAQAHAVQEVERIFRITDFVLYFHHEKLDSRLSLDQHQEHFEKTLQASKEREDERHARLQMKRKKFAESTKTGA